MDLISRIRLTFTGKLKDGKVTLMVLFLMIGSPCAMCQERTAPTKDRKYSIGFHFATGVYGSDQHYPEGGAGQSLNIEEHVIKSKPYISYSGGISIAYLITKNCYFESGAQYSRKGYSEKETDLFYGDQIDPRYGFEYDDIDNLKTRFIYQYIDVPVKVVKSFGDKKWVLTAGAGVTSHFLLSAIRLVKFDSDNNGPKRYESKLQSNHRQFNVSPVVSGGVGYNVNHRLQFIIEPEAKYQLLKITDGKVSSRLWSIDLKFTTFIKI